MEFIEKIQSINKDIKSRKKKKFFYNSEELEIDISKCNIEVVKYTDLCEWFDGYNIKVNVFKVYDDSYLTSLPKEFVDRLNIANNKGGITHMTPSQLWIALESGEFQPNSLFSDQDGNIFIFYNGKSLQVHETDLDESEIYVGLCVGDKLEFIGVWNEDE